MIGNVFDIKHFAVFDGPGIRTTLFLKGCPLKCVWCHNPEGLIAKSQLAYNSEKCVGCGRCVTVCKYGAHTIDAEGNHRFVRENCVLCGQCVTLCPAKTLTLYGKMRAAKDVIAELLKDKDFYDCSGGGITISGGECLLQADFCCEILESMKEAGVHTAVDTNGFIDQDKLCKVMPFTDLFLYDIKAFDEDVHIRCTGYSNRKILENLRYLDAEGKSFEVRIPLVPHHNDDQIDKIGEFLSNLTHLTKVRVLPYHNYAKTKYTSLGLVNTLPAEVPSDKETENAKRILKKWGLSVAE